MKVLWMPSALDDLESIKEYIARDSIVYADKFADEALRATERLGVFPESGRKVPEVDDPSLREIVYGSYRIIYEIADSIHIVAMIHGRRLLTDCFVRDF